MELENKELCSKCGGKCCKKSGCDYSVNDFSNKTFAGFIEVLKDGNISIVSSIKFNRNKDGKLLVEPVLYLRARNINRDVIDLFSMKTTCSMLTDKGCSYDTNHRPSGGLNLIPSENQQCYPYKNPISIVEGWISYQNILEKIVKKYTGKSIYDKLKEDIENTLYDFIIGKVDGVSIIEIKDMKNITPLLLEAYPDIAERILNKIKISNNQKCLHR